MSKEDVEEMLSAFSALVLQFGSHSPFSIRSAFMPQSLIREPNGNVVLRSDNVAVRLFPRYGGSALEWWSEPFPLLTNPFPGSGAFVNWETGQDPTQASANGPLENPICYASNPATARFNYYSREYLFDAAGGYGVMGFCPDFWLSHEAIDDAAAPNPDGTDSGWRTKYAPGSFANALSSIGCPVIFQGTRPNWSGLFFVGNEIDRNPVWNRRLRSYGEGRIAFKLFVSLRDSDATSFAGVLFRKSVPSTAGISKHEAFAAPGLHLYIYRSGDWGLYKMNNGASTKVVGGKLSKAQRSALVGIGLEVEVQTHNILQDHIELYFGGVLAASIEATGCNRGAHACLFASTHSGYVTFAHRHFVHVGVQFESLYRALPNATVVTDLKVTSIVPEPVPFYRANLPGVFMNQQTFVKGNRRCAGLKNGTWQKLEGFYRLNEFEKFYVGNNEGTAGLCAKIEVAEVNGVKNDGAHLLIHPHVINDEFVLMLNPLSLEQNDVPIAAKSLRIKTTWTTKI